jgi:hypothetical protein
MSQRPRAAASLAIALRSFRTSLVSRGASVLRFFHLLVPLLQARQSHLMGGPQTIPGLRIKAAFSRNKARVTQASIIERAVPSAALSPFAPGDVIAILAVGISRFPGCTKDAQGGIDRTGDYVPGRRGFCQHRKRTAATPISLKLVMRSSLDSG